MCSQYPSTAFQVLAVLAELLRAGSWFLAFVADVAFAHGLLQLAGSSMLFVIASVRSFPSLNFRTIDYYKPNKSHLLNHRLSFV